MARVFIVRHAYYPQETHVRRNVEALISQGHEVHLVCLKDQGQSREENISGAHIHRQPVGHKRTGAFRYIFEYAAFFIMAFFKLLGSSLASKIDYVEVDTMPDFLVFCALGPKLRGAKIILYLFEAFPEYFAYKFDLPASHWSIKLLAWIEQSAIRFSNHVLTACEAFQATFVNRGADISKITVVLNVPNQNYIDMVADVVMEKHSTFNIIYHGTLLDLYGVQTILEALKILKDKITGLRFTVPGDGEYLPTLKKLRDKLGLQDVSTFLGWLPQTEVFRHIINSDLGIVATLRGYGDIAVPNKLFEYIAFDKPVVCSDLPGIRYYFDESSLFFFTAGNAVDMADQIYEVYSNTKLVERKKESAKKIYLEHRWEKEKFIYLSVFHQ